MDFSSATDAQLREIDELLAQGGVQRRARRRPPSTRARQCAGISAQRANGLRASRLEVLRVPEWGGASGKRAGDPAMDWLVHGFSTRTGGLTRVYRPEANAGGDLNLGFTVHDDPKTVRANRKRFIRAVWGETRGPQLVTLKQIHSSLIRRVDGDDAFASRESSVGQSLLLKGDGLMTDRPGILLGIQTADCLPILVVDRKRRAVAVFHAGWRGTLQRIVEGGVGRMRLEFGSRPEDLVAAIGPGIGLCCYAVGDEVRREFEAQFAYAPELFREVYGSEPIKEKYPLLFMTARAPGHSNLGPSLHLDLAEANRRQLLAAGLKPTAIYVTGECTGCQTQRFFSHRSEHGYTGRMMSVIGIRT